MKEKQLILCRRGVDPTPAKRKGFVHVVRHTLLKREIAFSSSITIYLTGEYEANFDRHFFEQLKKLESFTGTGEIVTHVALRYTRLPEWIHSYRVTMTHELKEKEKIFQKNQKMFLKM